MASPRKYPQTDIARIQRIAARPDDPACGTDISIEELGQAGAFAKGNRSHEVLRDLQAIDLSALGASDYFCLDHYYRDSYALYSSREPPNTSAPFLSFVRDSFPSHWNLIADLGIETFTTARIPADTTFYMKAKKCGNYAELSISLQTIATLIFTALSAICAELCFCNQHAAVINFLHGKFAFCPHCAALASWSAIFTDEGILKSYRRGLTRELNNCCLKEPLTRGHYHFEILGRIGIFYVTIELLQALYAADILSAYEELLDGFFRIESRNTTTNNPLNEKPCDPSSRKMIALYVLQDDRLAFTKPRHLTSIDTFKQFIARNYSRK